MHAQYGGSRLVRLKSIAVRGQAAPPEAPFEGPGGFPDMEAVAVGRARYDGSDARARQHRARKEFRLVHS
jgi:hypothetical protein